MLVTLSLAFTAGLVSTVNPCGFAMLPAYLSYFMGLDENADSARSPAIRGLATGLVVSGGFFLIFGLAGALLVVGVRTVQSVIPWVALLVGVGVAGLGLVLLRGQYVNLRIPTIKRVSKDQSLSSVFLFGVSYAVASLSCTLPVFLSVVVGAFTTQSFIAGFAAFVSYGLGMSVVLMGITMALALGKDSLVRRLRGSARFVNRASGAILVLAGGFVVFYWSVVLFSGAENLNNFGVTRLVETASAWATQVISSYPIPLTLTVAAALVAVLVYGRRSGPVDESAEEREPATLAS
ncbi:MAG: cytochrome c biogenesis CcdA family protein [Acidimicrobiia bacterium]